MIGDLVLTFLLSGMDHYLHLAIEASKRFGRFKRNRFMEFPLLVRIANRELKVLRSIFDEVGSSKQSRFILNHLRKKVCLIGCTSYEYTKKRSLKNHRTALRQK